VSEGTGDTVEPEPPQEPEVRPRPVDGRPHNRTARFAWGAVAVILVGVIALVVFALTGPPPSPGVVHRVVTSSGIVAELAGVPASVFDSVGVTATQTPLVAPRVVPEQPPLTAKGKPEILFVGADFCPFCGAERWPLIVALSRFGHFTVLHNVQTAALSVFSSIQTFSFVGSSYTSPYLTFTGTELYSDAVNAHGAYTRIATLSPAQSALVARYGGGSAAGSASGSYPFVDIGNTMVASTSGFSPAVLVGQSQSTIAGSLSQADQPSGQPTDQPIGQAIVSSANYLTAGICLATDHRPQAVCSSRSVRVADQALGISPSPA
jgi:hypothetical protein